MAEEAAPPSFADRAQAIVHSDPWTSMRYEIEDEQRAAEETIRTAKRIIALTKIKREYLDMVRVGEKNETGVIVLDADTLLLELAARAGIRVSRPDPNSSMLFIHHTFSPPDK